MRCEPQLPRIIGVALLCSLILSSAGGVRVIADPSPQVQITNADFAGAGERTSALISASDAVIVELQLDEGEVLQITFANLPPAIGRLEVHFSDHRLCSALLEFVEFRIQGFSQEGFGNHTESTRPECGMTLFVEDVSLVACDNRVSGIPTCSEPITLSYRPGPAAGSISGTVATRIALAIDVSAGPAFGPTNLLVTYASVSQP
jgi:hypothetical protein